MQNLFFYEIAPEGFIHLFADEHAFADDGLGKGLGGKFAVHIVKAVAAAENAFGAADSSPCVVQEVLFEGSEIGFGKDFFRFGAEIAVIVGGMMVVMVMMVMVMMVIVIMAATAGAVALVIGDVVLAHAVGQIEDHKAVDFVPGGGNYGEVIPDFVDAADHFSGVATFCP